MNGKKPLPQSTVGEGMAFTQKEERERGGRKDGGIAQGKYTGTKGGNTFQNSSTTTQ